MLYRTFSFLLSFILLIHVQTSFARTHYKTDERVTISRAFSLLEESAKIVGLEIVSHEDHLSLKSSKKNTIFSEYDNKIFIKENLNDEFELNIHFYEKEGPFKDYAVSNFDITISQDLKGRELAEALYQASEKLAQEEATLISLTQKPEVKEAGIFGTTIGIGVLALILISFNKTNLPQNFINNIIIDKGFGWQNKINPGHLSPDFLKNKAYFWIGIAVVALIVVIFVVGAFYISSGKDYVDYKDGN